MTRPLELPATPPINMRIALRANGKHADPAFELLVRNDFGDEVLLFIGAIPSLGFQMPIAVVTVAVPSPIWQEPDFLNRSVHSVLQEFIEPGTFGLDLGDIGQLCPERNGELVAAVLWQTDLF
jgi:hypothetical protein